MRTINGHYIKDSKEVLFNCKVPERWHELERKQFASIIQVMNFRKADKHTIAISLVALLFGKENFHILTGLTDDLLCALVPLTNFLVEEKPEVKNFFPELKIRKKKSLAPADDLSNITFGEWCFIFQFYQYYQIDQDVSWLNKLIAVLYRPADPEQDPDSAKFKGDLREVFNENLISKRAKDVAAIEKKYKDAVLAWFILAIHQVMDRRPNVFPASAENDPEAPAVTEQPDQSRTWMSIFRELLGPKWGTAEQLKNTNAMFVLDALEEQQISYNESLTKTTQ